MSAPWLQRLEGAGLVVRTAGRIAQVEAGRLAADSRKVEPGGLFVAIRGFQTDGHRYIDQAVRNGAVAVVCEALPEAAAARFPGVGFVQVASTCAALAELASAWSGDPSETLCMVGVTGTNGKTTTTYLIHHLLTALGEPAGLIGTIAYRLGEAPTAATYSTPDALALHPMLRQMIEAGVKTCVMEVSSHGLDQDRVLGRDFDVAVFTNLTRDHLDYHRSFEAYRCAKKKLFDPLAPEATALFNLDDPEGAKMVADTRARVVSYGQSTAADLRVEVLANRIEGLRLRLDGEARRFRLVGLFNAYNLVAAYGAGRALGYDRTTVLDALATAPPVPGRFEQIRFGDGTTVVVDYAHTPDALENVLQAVRGVKPAAARLWCVFGCGGERDPPKRPMMGAIAERYADRVIVTSDNPRTEDPEAILDDIREGMQRPDEAAWIVDRRAAIETAATRAQPGDVVLVAGKGHEPYQILGSEKIPFDDRDEVRRSFARRG